MKAEFKKLFANALRRRLHPNTGLHRDQLAYALGVHAESVKNWLRGESCPDGGTVSACINFFARTGDHAFLQELFPDACAPFVQRQKRAEKAIAFAESFQAFVQMGATA
jgi:hypothetical protein